MAKRASISSMKPFSISLPVVPNGFVYLNLPWGWIISQEGKDAFVRAGLGYPRRNRLLSGTSKKQTGTGINVYQIFLRFYQGNEPLVEQLLNQHVVPSGYTPEPEPAVQVKTARTKTRGKTAKGKAKGKGKSKTATAAATTATTNGKPPVLPK